jgi:putative transcriptional regulator
MKARKKATLGERLVESAREAVRIEGGEAKPARVTRYTAAGATVEPPPRYVPDRIRGIRGHMALSQPVFAATLNVSAETVRAWEQGKREPDGPTLRLLEVAEQHPEVLLAKVRPRLPAVPCRRPVSRRHGGEPEVSDLLGHGPGSVGPGSVLEGPQRLGRVAPPLARGRVLERSHALGGGRGAARPGGVPGRPQVLGGPAEAGGADPKVGVGGGTQGL